MFDERPITMGLRPHFDDWQTTRFNIPLHLPLVMGIVNITPDSFSDRGEHVSPEQAIYFAEKQLSEGADILDVGGESTRPGATPLTSQEEWTRISPVLKEVLKWNIPVSIDTYHPETMSQALDLGVDIINDIYALRTPGALNVIARTGVMCGLCLMHMHGEPLYMQQEPIDENATSLAKVFFQDLLKSTDHAGIDRRRIVIDPGIGFGKTVRQNFQLLRYQSELLELDSPLMVGWSRKSSLGAVTDRSVDNRLIPSVAAALISVMNGASIVRVHDVGETRAALKVWNATLESTHSIN